MSSITQSSSSSEGSTKPNKKHTKWQTLDWTRSPSSPNTNPIAQAKTRPAKSYNNKAPVHVQNNGKARNAQYHHPNHSRQEKSLDSFIKAMQTISMAKAAVVPLTEFTIFGDLHPELRLRIWGVFCESFPGRLLEVEVDKQAAAAANMSGSHCFTQVTRSSSIDHLPLFICRESREEALKVWKPVEFGDYARPVRRITYFNQARDTIYCGEGNCMRTIVFSFNKQAQAGIDIPRVAILCSGQVLAGCCDLAPEDQMGGVDDYELVTGRAFANGCTPMQLLHGIDFDFSGSRFYQSCVGLKEISWIVPTKLIDVKGWRDPSWHRIASLCRERLNYRPREVEASHRGRHRACEFRGRSRQCRHKPVPTFPNSAGCLSPPMPNQARSTKL